ncbi:MAG: c-type cytochrome [Gammaproteobacteria bacterium]
MYFGKLAAGLAALLLAAPVVALDAEQAGKVTETRQGLLKVVGWNFTPLNAMARGLVPWDDALVERNAQRIAWMTTMLPDAFRGDTRGHALDTEARPVIWERFDRFEELAANAQASAERLVEVATGGDEAATKRAISALLDDCRACHNDFRDN